MYNGIGLTTVRGSATSGHVSKNLSYIKPEFFRNKLDVNTNTSALGIRGGFNNDDRKNNGLMFKTNKDVIEHNRNYAFEAELYEISENMRENGSSEEQIERKISEMRKKQSSVSNYQVVVKKSKTSGTDTHELNARKADEDKKLRNAFGISDNYVPGASFDPAVQAERKAIQEQQWAIKQESMKIENERRQLVDDRERATGREVSVQDRIADDGARSDGRYVPRIRDYSDSSRRSNRNDSRDRYDPSRRDDRRENERDDRQRDRNEQPPRHGERIERRDDRQRDRNEQPLRHGERIERRDDRQRDRNEQPPRLEEKGERVERRDDNQRDRNEQPPRHEAKGELEKKSVVQNNIQQVSRKHGRSGGDGHLSDGEVNSEEAEETSNKKIERSTKVITSDKSAQKVARRSASRSSSNSSSSDSSSSDSSSSDSSSDN